ncbi:MAG: hypothetical protein ABSG49_11680 [Methanoregula sp.]|jgi:hypothetical protein|uniref:hypothetical protein n=1 Tax=Methanoregula sp. TaxID=2052170 RepID=UPI003C1C6E60
MNSLSPDRQIILFMAAVVILVTAIHPTASWYLTLFLLALYVSVYWLTRTWHDRAFYLVCFGALLVVTCGAASIWEELIVAWMVGGSSAIAMGMTVSRNDLPALLALGSCTLAVALMIYLSNHVLLPLFVLSALTAGIAAVLAIRDYQFRKQCSGARV